jgi:hypothetical protein
MSHRVTLLRTDVSECIVFLRGVRRLLVTANVPSSPILVTLMMETLRSSETSFLQEPHGVTSQKTAIFTVTGRDYLKSYKIYNIKRMNFIVMILSSHRLNDVLGHGTRVCIQPQEEGSNRSLCVQNEEVQSKRCSKKK